MTRKPASETSDQDASSRRDRLDARRSRRTRITVALVVLVLAGAAAAGAYALKSDEPQAHASGSDDPGAAIVGAGGTFSATGAAKAPAPRAVDHEHPMRLWIGGDSLAGAFGPALGDRVGATGVAQALIDYRVSSGLWSNDLRNWYQRATDQMASENPDAVVFMIGTNDAPVVNKVDNNNDGVADWQAEYRMKVARMMDLFVGPNHRTVFWLGPPTLGTDNMDRGAKAISQVMREEAMKRAPDVVFLDTYKLFSTEDGSYSRRVIDENGKEITARISDGTHFTESGAQFLARAVFALVDARWRLSNQADLADPIGWTMASGSGESVPGFSSKPRSRYRPSQSGSNETTTSSVSATTFVAQTTTTVGSPSSTVAATTVPSTAPPTSTSKPSTPSTTAHTTTTGP